jgi:hypothetical protein
LQRLLVMTRVIDRKWRGSASLKGYRSRLVRALNAPNDGETVQLEIRTTKALLEILDQAIHTEEGHGV